MTNQPYANAFPLKNGKFTWMELQLLENAPVFSRLKHAIFNLETKRFILAFWRSSEIWLEVLVVLILVPSGLHTDFQEALHNIVFVIIEEI